MGEAAEKLRELAWKARQLSEGRVKQIQAGPLAILALLKDTAPMRNVAVEDIKGEATLVFAGISVTENPLVPRNMMVLIDSKGTVLGVILIEAENG